MYRFIHKNKIDKYIDKKQDIKKIIDIIIFKINTIIF
jgi:hypothetical protein